MTAAISEEPRWGGSADEFTGCRRARPTAPQTDGVRGCWGLEMQLTSRKALTPDRAPDAGAVVVAAQAGAGSGSRLAWQPPAQGTFAGAAPCPLWILPRYWPPHTLRYLRYPAAAADDDDDDALPSLPLIHGVSLVVSRPTARPSGLSPPPFTRTRTRIDAMIKPRP
ncbi:hypothetical protein PCL_01888 [Purpureocillium lilacinum]|uniref:Uncharacterized protein n=1 Tax=Purpureocillium lilacinum TaxID=33203 RepID=A0A2U3E2T4_PURLI|nr:hypothetical protein PCL_01888 [Purpureocillium lilacinum]